MKEVTVKVGQNIWDIALQEYGDVTGVFDIFTENNISVSDTIKAGAVLMVNENIQNKIVTDFFKVNPKPATALKQDIEVTQNDGIGYMVIGETFRVF